MFLLFIFVLTTNAMEAKLFMLFKRSTSEAKEKQTGKVNPGVERLSILHLGALAGVFFILIQGCAKVGKPTGGPSDVNPPTYLKGEPENRATNFTGEKISITFDEYIQLKNQNKEILISPPLKERPVIRIKEKTIQVALNNKLLPQTTYTLNFGNAVSDLNESNILPDFEFVFSTGEKLDSLSITGKVINAFDHSPQSEGGILVMLYENLADSAPLIEIPRYYGKANKNGLFSINNIHPDTFRVIALKDDNGNLLYNPGIESVAFLDSLLIISVENVKPLTFIKDTVKIITKADPQLGRGNKKNTTKTVADTVIAPGRMLNALNITLYNFTEESDKVFLTSRKRDAAENITFTFSRPLFDTLQVTPINFKPADKWFLKEFSHHNDTLTYWITDTLLAKKDTLKLQLTYLTTDSTGRFMERTDTLTMRYQKAVARGSAGRRNKTAAEEPKKKVLSLSGSISNRGMLNLNKAIVFTANRPLQTVNPEGIELYRIIDSLSYKQAFTCLNDSFSIRRFRLESKWEEDSKYKLLLKPGTASDIYGLTNDSLGITFSTQKADYYGRILLTIGGSRYPLIIQLLNQKEKVVDTKYIKQAGITIFDYLSPDKYSLKAIYDINDNGIWDTGNYLKHIQPEQVFLHTMPSQLRSSWDYEVTWIIPD